MYRKGVCIYITNINMTTCTFTAELPLNTKAHVKRLTNLDFLKNSFPLKLHTYSKKEIKQRTKVLK